MNKKLFIISLLLISLILVGGLCRKKTEELGLEFQSSGNGQEQEQVIETEEEKLSMEVEKGENFKISLEVNLTTGYYWSINFDSPCIEFINLEYIENEEPEMIGVPGTQIFELKAVEESEGTEIIFSYERSWENKPPLEKKIYTIIIK